MMTFHEAAAIAARARVAAARAESADRRLSDARHAEAVAERIAENAKATTRRAYAAAAAAAVAASRASDAVADAAYAIARIPTVRPLAEPGTPVYNRVTCQDCNHCFTQNDSEPCPDCGATTK